MRCESTAGGGGIEFGSNSIPHYPDVRDRSGDVFEDVAAWFFGPMSITSDERAERVIGMLVSANFFQTYGAGGFDPVAFLGVPVLLFPWRDWPSTSRHGERRRWSPPGRSGTTEQQTSPREPDHLVAPRAGAPDLTEQRGPLVGSGRRQRLDTELVELPAQRPRGIEIGRA